MQIDGGGYDDLRNCKRSMQGLRTMHGGDTARMIKASAVFCVMIFRKGGAWDESAGCL